MTPYNGYTLRTKPYNGYTLRTKAMDAEIALDMLEMAAKLDHAVLFSGDADFCCLVEAVRQHGTKVSVVSNIQTAPPMVADELRRQADQFIELADIAAEFTRPPRRKKKGT